MNSIIIISDYNDTSSHEVIDWLDFKGIDFDLYDLQDLITSTDFAINIPDINYQNPVSFWMRKYSQVEEYIASSEEVYLQLNELETKYCKSFWLNKPSDKYIDKAQQLNHAANIGLHIPQTIITGNKNAIRDFVKREKCIIKRINLIYKEIKNESYVWYTDFISSEEIDDLPEGLYIVQKYIEKEFEIRSFFCNQNFIAWQFFRNSMNRQKLTLDNTITKNQIEKYLVIFLMISKKSFKYL